jgi:NTE family protein
MGAARVGLVLGAGGVAGGAFHAGVLAALEAVTGWDPRRADVVVGTSAGSVTGASLRAGLSAPDLFARSEGRPLSEAGAALMHRVGPPHRPPPLRAATTARAPGEVAAVLRRAMARPLAARPSAVIASLLPDGAASTDPIARAMGELFADSWPAEDLWICAVRQSDGVRVVFGRDASPPVADAVAASCAIPGFYAPVQVDGHAHIDGGVHSPTNLDVLAAADLDLDLVVVSSPMSRSGRRMGIAAGDAVRRWSGLLLDRETQQVRRYGTAVVTFEPNADDVAAMGPNAMDAERRAIVARRAHDSTLRHLDGSGVRSRLAALGG